MTGRAAWSAEVRRHFRLARGAGEPGPGGQRFGHGAAGAVSWGTQVRIGVTLDQAGHIVDLSWRCYGCPATQAACSWLAATVPRMHREQAAAVTATAMAEALALPAERLGPLIVVEDALRDALQSAGMND